MTRRPPLPTLFPYTTLFRSNPYLGRDSLEPFLAACRHHGAGLFCLVKTSNPGSGDVQDARLADGAPLWQHVARLVDRKSTRLNSSHMSISYAVFCLKKKKII